MNAVITGWSAVSAYGFGRHAFTEGVVSGRATAAPAMEGAPDTHVCWVPDLDPKNILDGKGIRHLDRASQLALATFSELVEPGVDTGERAGVVLGTTAGSHQVELDQIRDTHRNARPHHLAPKQVASGTMNCAAAQCAIRFGIHGPNTTVAGGRGAALHALGYARRLLAMDRADSVIVGAVEEATFARAWFTHAAGTRPGQWLGEGGAAFRVEPSGTSRPVLAEVLGIGTRLALNVREGHLPKPQVGEGGLHDTLATCVREVLARAEVSPSSVHAVVGPEPEGLFKDLADVPDLSFMGDTGSVSSAYAIVTALGVLRLPGEVVLVTSADPDGAVACALLRLGNSRSDHDG
ncbi:hypothetical protein Lesp02_12880 [Lentzea sp. NBRC 105346]|uniref:beta-ketoacyl synthase N-terminal-like domain-containing protein n=1 Tax=Lentzea sp. NBRC 105346 TaxID=3032205 RepID=UPI0024A5C6B9|nr:beta-ketoacyl synthase N-terminal-like domain-containing protein [Lentzea sp. NBRC 105346]GLZ29098.1 hypothetical protein Lesp02_12880 [Lentzea sp. NBRC 105346]